MEIVKVDSNNIKAFIEFSKSIYNGNPYYRDTMSRTLYALLKGKAKICKGSFIEGVIVKKDNKILTVCLFCIVDRMDDVLQMAYFESLEDEEALAELIFYGKEIAKRNSIKKILVGLNLHVNYGLGLLDSHFDEIQSLGSSYNPEYYIKMFEKIATEEISLISYLVNMKSFNLNIDKRIENKILKEYSARKANFRKLEEEASLYTEVNNKAFMCHDFYYERRISEDLELFREFKLLLKEENLLFLEREGKTIGFMLWYPDFNQLLNQGESLGLKMIIKNKFLNSKINKFKIVEIGVIPEYQNTGAVFALFHECFRLTRNRYEFCESGWILEKNMSSKGFGIRWADKEYKRYKAFLIDV